ncbi:protein of unknown function (plasmid) [Cupriavidus taiwanensis]|nr:protein of unknown function [Cupriavidus taiwanensis]
MKTEFLGILNSDDTDGLRDRVDRRTIAQPILECQFRFAVVSSK